MTKKLQSVRGTKDVMFEEMRAFRHIVDTAQRVGALYGFEEISTPIFEFTEVFKRTLGETSDVVNKEMYSFEDRGGESLTLRPEFTAGIARAFISGGLQQHLPLKFFSAGPLFRYERPQKGRQRQFHQVNFEWLGVQGPEYDSEIIMLAIDILRELGILSKTMLHINTLGDAESRQNYRDTLVAYLSKYKNDLSEDSRMRLEKNPLRILDSKDEGDKKIVAGAPSMTNHLTESARAYFDAVVENLTRCPHFKEQVVVNPKLVRGLDYYSHTVFEFIAEDEAIGAQNTVLAGGRYDGLVGQLGGSETPAIGFASGIERLALLLQDVPEKAKPVAIIPLVEKDEGRALRLATALRHAGHYAEMIYGGNLGKRLTKANKQNASHAVIIGQEEMEKGVVTLKNLTTGEQKEVAMDKVVNEL